MRVEKGKFKTLVRYRERANVWVTLVLVLETAQLSDCMNEEQKNQS